MDSTADNEPQWMPDTASEANELMNMPLDASLISGAGAKFHGYEFNLRARI